MDKTLLQTLLAGWLVMSFAGCGEAADTAEESQLPPEMKKLLPLHNKLGKPKAGDWLAEHEEPGQSYAQYLRSWPTVPEGRRRTIYIQPLGEFTKTQRKIVDLTAEFMGIYYELPVKIREDFPLDMIPDEARRTHPSWGDKQILSTYVLDKVLVPRLPDDAAVYIALTSSDLWPGGGWNFVFGQASLGRRVGVWSIYRNGDPEAGDAAFRLCLLRTVKTAVHETGHMFSMNHCTLYRCLMGGSNSQDESDRQPLALCPHCLGKLLHATKVDVPGRFERLAAFCNKYGWTDEAAFFEKSLETIR
ncbi:MAG: hypothetical protein HQ581_28430 [Planctomycetes bacterium]|nr:hypothetical protein [Planctomycetota bacterium]